jgi:hypothetical protein
MDEHQNNFLLMYTKDFMIILECQISVYVGILSR